MIRSEGLRYHYAQGPDLAFPDVDLPQGGTLLLTGAPGLLSTESLGAVTLVGGAASGGLCGASRVA